MTESVIITWLALHSRKSERPNQVGPFKYGRCLHSHTAGLNEKLREVGFPPWEHAQWSPSRLPSLPEASSAEPDHWKQCAQAKGHVVGLALCKGPFSWSRGTLALESWEQRLWSSILEQPPHQHLAFTEVIDVVALSDFAHNDIPLSQNCPDLVPLVWCNKRQVWHVAPRKDFYILSEEAAQRFAEVPCFQVRPHEVPRACGPARHKIQTWINTHLHDQGEPTHTALHLPAPIATLMLYSACRYVPALFHTLPSRRRGSLDYMPHGARPAGPPPPRSASVPSVDRPLAGSPTSQITPERFTALADDLRFWAKHFEQHIHHFQADVRSSPAFFAGWCEWAEACHRELHVQDVLGQARRGRQHLLDRRQLFAMLWLSYSLRKDSGLKKVAQEVLLVMLQEGPLRDWVQKAAPLLAGRLPSASTISRSRLAFDASWQLWFQSHLTERLSSQSPMVVNLMADSTPMFGQEWFVVSYELSKGGPESGGNLFQLMHAFFAQAAVQQCHALDNDGTHLVAQVEPLSKSIFEEHTCVPTGLGSGRASIAHKIHNIVHALGVDLNRWELVQGFCKKVTYLTTDMGVEALLATASTEDFNEAFWPQICRHAAASPLLEAFADGTQADQATCIKMEKLFEKAAWIPGTLHILHTVSEDITKVLLEFAPFLEKLRKVTQFLSNSMLVQRFAETCLQPHEEAHYFAELFKKAVSCSLADWRWMSLIHAIHTVLDRQWPLRLYFKLPLLYFRAPAGPRLEEDGPPQEETHILLKDCAGALEDPYFWAYAQMLSQLQWLLVSVEALAYACPCHPQRLAQLRQNRERSASLRCCPYVLHVLSMCAVCAACAAHWRHAP